MLKYAAADYCIWDAWYLPIADTVHMYHLRSPRQGRELPDEQVAQLGYAVSDDLIHWQERPAAFGPEPGNDEDDIQPWTGCCLWHDDRGYLFYTMRGSRHQALVQNIGLATTTDPARWTRHSANPVITPDPTWYADIHRPTPGTVDCRDLIIARDPGGKGWWGFYATRIPASPLPATSAIACVWSADLIHWEHRPPAFVPGNIACVEVPDVFELDGLWYMTCLAGNTYGNRGYWSDPNVNMGTLYAVSDRPEGPYRMLDDNILLGSREMDTITCRSLMYQGTRYLLYTDMQRVDGIDGGGAYNGTLTTPKELRTDGQKLYAAYSPRIESEIIDELIAPGRLPARESTDEMLHRNWQVPVVEWSWQDSAIAADADGGWGVLAFEPTADSYIFEATIEFRGAVAAGLLLRGEDYHNRLTASLDRTAVTVEAVNLPLYDILQRRQLPAALFDRPIHLRVVSRLETVEIYVNDKLYLAFPRYRGIGSKVGLFVDRGSARFSGIRLRSLDVTPA